MVFFKLKTIYFDLLYRFLQTYLEKLGSAATVYFFLFRTRAVNVKPIALSLHKIQFQHLAYFKIPIMYQCSSLLNQLNVLQSPTITIVVILVRSPFCTTWQLDRLLTSFYRMCLLGCYGNLWFDCFILFS